MKKYEIMTFGETRVTIPRQFEHFFVAGGSDHRAYEVLRKCKKKGINIGEVVMFDFKERRNDSDDQRKIRYLSYRRIKYKFKTIECSVLDPSGCVKSFSQHGLKMKPTENIAIDISCFTKPYFYAILKYLKDILKINNIVAFYTEPISYVFSGGLYNSFKSSIGPVSVIELPGFPGDDKGKDKKLLIILVGFEGDLATSINEDIAPDYTIIVNGFPGYSPKFKDISLLNNERIISVSNTVSYARANNPFETFNLLENIARKNENAFINIAPIGTKPMALGACLYAITQPSVRVLYPLPEKYENITTEKSSWSWYYDLPLS